ncbi:glutathione S-transferase 3-like [Dermochelys coriacea]|uniref:glutathione S-transferase 3-like n=1 Tax=Dermochelys coriacea TaxID=27794 RepID=UPI001CA91F7C|nr:glutathione S-transferase 3-like [Dermochelys coriacea]
MTFSTDPLLPPLLPMTFGAKPLYQVLFQQVPLVEIDGMKMLQTRAILSYIAAKCNLYGKDLKERAMYCNNAILTQSSVAFKARISNIPTVKKFLEPGSQRKPVPDDKYMETVKKVLQMNF